MTILLTDKKVATILEPRHMLELVYEYKIGVITGRELR